MHRIDAEGHQNHTFFDGDSTGAEKVPATVLPAVWLNDVQENLCKLIESRNGSPIKGEDSQLAKLVGEPLNHIEMEILKLKEEIKNIWTKVG